jgi:hypothetical protein
MCNIAGYIGDRPAAPILIEMMKRQEGFCGGYYTGITTLHEGKLYHAKVMGDVETFLEQTGGMEFPGNVGIIHSRSKSGGDWHWGHPFVSPDDSLSLILNGAKDKFMPLCDDDGAARLLWEAGTVFETECPWTEKLKNYPRLPNGSSVHFSEVLCLLADYYKKEGNLPAWQAVEKAFLRMPGEIVALGLYANDPGTVTFAKYNMPMSVARTEREVFIGSFSVAFPKDREYLTLDELPSASSGSITLDGTFVHRFKPVLELGRMTPQILHDAWEAVLQTLREEGPCSIGRLNKAVRVLWGDKVDLRYPATYSILQQLEDQGRLEIHSQRVPGAAPGLTAPAFTVSLKE